MPLRRCSGSLKSGNASAAVETYVRGSHTLAQNSPEIVEV